MVNSLVPENCEQRAHELEAIYKKDIAPLMQEPREKSKKQKYQYFYDDFDDYDDDDDSEDW